MATRITRRFEFDAGHRVLGHEGKCRHIHGHRYVAEVTVTAEQLDTLGRVIDFGVLKERVGKWIEYNWDHNLLLHPSDPLFALLEEADGNTSLIGKTGLEVLGGKAPFLMPPGSNPTAENMARRLYEVVKQLLDDTVLSVVHVRLYETPNCYADHEE